jgi:hypothetical protein
MNAKQLQSEIEETLMRNFKILQESSRWEIIRSDDFADMLRASAANLAQIYADRISDDE